VAWTRVHSTEALSLPATLHVGLIAFRNGGTGLAKAIFTNVQLRQLPDGWSNSDVGSVRQPGAAIEHAGTISVSGAGSDIWSTADAFQFAYRRWTGDGDFVTRVDSLSSPAGSSFSLAALMLRETLAPGSRHASIMVSSDGKAKFRRRSAANAETASDGPAAGSVSTPRWLKLTRRADLVTAFISADGVAWQKVHTAQTIAMGANIYVGLVALRNGGTLDAEARFSHLAFTAP
jgi:hypothetical protein